MNAGNEGWLIASFVLHLAGATGCLMAAGWLLSKGDPQRPDRPAAIGALCLTALWCALVASFGAASPPASLAETLRNLGWIFLLYRLFANDGRDANLAPIRPVVVALAFVECLQPALLVARIELATTARLDALVFEVVSLFRVLVAAGALLLVHNLYAGADNRLRAVLGWSAAALAGLWAYALNFYTIGHLGGSPSPELAALRGGVVLAGAALLALGGNAHAAELRLRPSRAVAFQSLSLLIIGGYLLTMIAVAYLLSLLGGDVGRLTQVGFVLAASVAALLWLPSKRLRGWLRVTAVKHLFQHRYDYRAEWLRFTDTIGCTGGRTGGQSGEGTVSLHERAVRALADITDSPAGLLLATDEDASMELAARWQWPEIAVPASPLGHDLSALLERSGVIVDLDDARGGRDVAGERAHLPAWLLGDPHAWALVPLVHYERIVGLVVLARPAVARRLDWEDFDLLKVVGRQLASYLAEQTAQQALMEAARFDEFNRRIAFVMHDVKNLASQLSLLARNAELHADNPAFRKDMLVTLTNSADKLNALLRRLGRYGAGGGASVERVDLLALVRVVAARFEGLHSVELTRSEPCDALADADALEQALVHIVQNAVDASEETVPVFIDVACEGLQGRIEVIDSGCGMSPQFVREQLFRPFVSSKPGGFGIGAFEARELVRAMGGRLDVESREGLGTRFAIRLPLAAAADIFAGAPAKANEV